METGIRPREYLLGDHSAEGLRVQEKTVIKKVAGGYRLVSEKGKNLGGPYKTKKAAEKRLKQVEFFKHKKA
jgi:hypothetical protein